MIVLTAADADKVRGLTEKGHALAPVPLQDGTFVLPADVLQDPAHALRRALLAALPQRDVGAAEYLDAKPAGTQTTADKTLLAGSTFTSTWPEGSAVALSTASAAPATI